MAKDVAKKPEQPLALPEDLVVPDGAGMEEADRDSFAIPFLQILQKVSPQVDPDDEAYIDGAKAGMFFDSVTTECLDSEKSELNVIPVFYRCAFVEWKTRDDGGGFVKEHSVDEAADLSFERDEKNRDMLPNGNQIVDTRYHYVILVTEDLMRPMVITMSSTQVKKSKRWMSDMDLQVRSLGLKSTFQTRYKIGTIGESNEHGTWRGWNITRNGLVAKQEELDSAISFYKAIKSGEVKEATDSLDPSSATVEAGEPQF